MINKYIAKILSAGLITTGLIWFSISNYDNIFILQNKEVQTIVSEPTPIKKEPIDWTPLATIIAGIAPILLEQYFKQKTQKKEKPIGLLDHFIFLEIQEILEGKLKDVSFKSPGRNKLFKTMIHTQLTSYRNLLKEYLINLPDFKNNEDFRKSVKLTLFSIKADYEKKWEELGVPEIVILKYKQWFGDRNDLILNDVDLTAYLDHESYEQRLVTVLTLIAFFVKLTVIEDSINTLNRLNGELKDTEFRGEKLE